ncbi:hypothetical protein KIW84_032435 [Lathyrus oleraceus]|uniref:Uncharacterized protein n=1 Tax=Pisum sativum TaxID=3888 RepID=A0A9D4XYH5_PEA|nr:hypothetical protein KIW84_032435 [Pisum sativum]
MEVEHGGYHALLRLGFEMDISLIQVLAITQNTSNQSKSFLAAVRSTLKPFHKRKKPFPEEEPPSSAPKTERDAYKKHVDDANQTACLMLATMNLELQKQHENMAAFDMIEHLKTLYQE